MAYKIQFTNNTNNAPLVVNDNTINTQTSLAFPGRNVVGFSTIIGEDFLHLLENFADSASPSNPVEGQLWYDNSEGSTQLRIYDGLNWIPAGSVNKSTKAPNSGSVGDLWIDTLHQQLYLYSGTNWVLVGPTFSSGLKSGLQVEIILDSLGIEKTILSTYLNDQIISIYSTAAFIPKTTISGFTTIKPGINISTNSFSDGSIGTKLWGTAEKAESLIVNGTTISAASFLRSDSEGLTTYPLSVKTDTGISVGTENQLKLQLSGSVGTLYHSTSQSALDLKLNISGQATTIMRLDATTGNVGINNLNPQAKLDVAGTAKISGDVHITSVTDSLTSSTGALIVDGGVTIQGNVNLNSDTYNSGTLYLNYGEGLSQSGGPYPGMMPTTDSNIDLGGTNSSMGYYPFGTIYANKFVAANQGSFVGNLTGNISGNSISTTRLQASTRFTMDGDVTSSGFSFDGLTGGTAYAIDTTVGTLGFVSKTGSGPYFVTFAIVIQPVKPPVGNSYIVSGNNNPSYNGSYTATGSTTTTITLQYNTNPGVYGAGTTTITAGTGLVKTFTTKLGSDLIASKEEVTDSSDSDVLLIYRPSAGLRKTSKPNFVKTLPLVPVGSIFPFAGLREKVPTGYLLCDGSEQEQAKYLDLFSVIGYTYGDPLKLKGRYSFKIPDLRGRFALGLDNMDNGNTVSTINGAQKTITTPANVVTDPAAKTIGNVSGSQTYTLDINNVPPHQHKLVGDKGTQFYALNTTTTTPTDSGSSKNLGAASSGGQRIDRTGDILFGPTAAQPLTVMNPFMSINYIIYAGKVYTT